MVSAYHSFQCAILGCVHQMCKFFVGVVWLSSHCSHLGPTLSLTVLHHSLEHEFLQVAMYALLKPSPCQVRVIHLNLLLSKSVCFEPTFQCSQGHLYAMMLCKEYGYFLILDPLVKIVGNSELFLIELCTTLFAKFKVKLHNCVTTFPKHPSLSSLG